MDDVTDIRAFYDAMPEEEERLTRHPLEEEITWLYLERYLPPQGAILEVGAATGRYTRELARRGYLVTAVDLSPVLGSHNRRRCEALGHGDRVRCLTADARDLGVLQGEVFDAALVMGPLYHLVHEQDRRQVLREVRALMRPAAPLVTAWISRLGILSGIMTDISDWITKQGEVESLLGRGRDSDEYPKGGFRAYCARVEEIAPLHESEGFETLVLAAAEPCIGAYDEPYNRLQGEQRRLWRELFFRVSTEPSIVGASRHLLYVGRRSMFG